MDVLSTSGGGVDVSMEIFATVFAILAVTNVCITFMSVVRRNQPAAFTFAVFAVITTFGSFVTYGNRYEPVRHEVTLKPGYVIDAEKYDIIEKRGRIYVIEEREVAE